MKTMKRLAYWMAAVAIFCCAACSKKSMTPVATKINGPLSDYFEVVSREYVPKDEKVSIEFRRIAEGFPAPWDPEMKVGYGEGYFEPQFTVEFQDADGNVLSKEQTDIVWNSDELNEIAALRVGETASIAFRCREGSQFKVGSTFEATPIDPMSGYVKILSDRRLTDSDMRGETKKSLEIWRNMIYAKYGYQFRRADLQEYFGQFRWYEATNPDASAIYSQMSSIEKYNIDFIKRYEAIAPEEIRYGSYDDRDADDENWDAVLDAYERCVDKYIALMKKAAAGDVSAVAEYTSLLEEVNEFGEKLGEANSDLSSAQLSRYMRVLNKVTEAAQQMIGM